MQYLGCHQVAQVIKLELVMIYEDACMSAIWTNHANRLIELINSNNDTHAHLYLEQLMLFPVDIQDKIINDVSNLKHCNTDDVANIITQYMMFEMK